MGGVKRASHALRAIRREHRPDRRPGMRRLPACVAAGSNFTPRAKAGSHGLASEWASCQRKPARLLRNDNIDDDGSQSLLPRFSILLRSSESSNVLPFAITLSSANYCKLVWRFYRQLRELIQA